MLLGATLVAIGILAGAVADKIRRLRTDGPRRERGQRDRSERRPARSAEPGQMTATGRHVAATIAAAGFPKRRAQAAVEECPDVERDTVERWTRAALQRCMTGGTR